MRDERGGAPGRTLTNMEQVITTTAVFAAFASLHSLTVSRAFKAALARFVGEARMRAYYRLAFTVFSALITLGAAYVILSLPDARIYTPAWPVLWAAHAVQLAGVALMLAAFIPFDTGYFTGLAQARLYIRAARTSGDMEGMPPGPLVITGAYGLVRHPMYLAGIIVFMFEPNITRNCLALRLCACAYFVLGALMEERRFIKDFGDGYIEYKKNVPMFNIIRGISIKGRGARRGA